MHLFFGQRYNDAIPILRILLLASGLGLLINPIIVMYYRLNRAKIVSYVHVSQLILIIILNIVLIPRFEAVGAAWARAIINIFAWLLLIGLSWRTFVRRSASANQ